MTLSLACRQTAATAAARRIFRDIHAEGTSHTMTEFTQRL